MEGQDGLGACLVVSSEVSWVGGEEEKLRVEDNKEHRREEQVGSVGCLEVSSVASSVGGEKLLRLNSPEVPSLLASVQQEKRVESYQEGKSPLGPRRQAEGAPDSREERGDRRVASKVVERRGDSLGEDRTAGREAVRRGEEERREKPQGPLAPLQQQDFLHWEWVVRRGREAEQRPLGQQERLARREQPVRQG